MRWPRCVRPTSDSMISPRRMPTLGALVRPAASRSCLAAASSVPATPSPGRPAMSAALHVAVIAGADHHLPEQAAAGGRAAAERPDGLRAGREGGREAHREEGREPEGAIRGAARAEAFVAGTAGAGGTALAAPSGARATPAKARATTAEAVAEAPAAKAGTEAPAAQTPGAGAAEDQPAPAPATAARQHGAG